MIGLFKKWFGSKPKVDFKALLAQGAVLVDVRSQEEFNQGHIKGSVNYPLGTLQQHIQALKKKDVPVITVCRSGARSGMGTSLLKQHGIASYNGGAWTRFNTLLT